MKIMGKENGFYFVEEAIINAETYLELGETLFRNIEKKLIDGDNSAETSWKMWPAFINIAFSCEILLKLLYERDNDNIVKGHKLYDEIFVKLKNNTQTMISSMVIYKMQYPGKKYDEQDFIDDMLLSQDTFMIERYPFELGTGIPKRGIKCLFLSTLAKTLLNIVNNMR